MVRADQSDTSTAAPETQTVIAPDMPEGSAEESLLYIMAPAFVALKMAFEAELGVNPHAARILLFLTAHDGVTQNELTTLLHTDPSMVTRTVKEMENDHGWIYRKRDAADNRLVRVFMTDAGRAKTDIIAKHLARVEQKLVGDFSADERRAFRHMCRAIAYKARRIYGPLKTDAPPDPGVQ